MTDPRPSRILAVGLGIGLAASAPSPASAQPRGQAPTLVLLAPMPLQRRPVLPASLPRQPAVSASARPAAALDGVCGPAILAAERRYALPPGLLAAIALTESGRMGETGRQPWPWTTNTDGQGRFFAAKADAIASVRQAQAAGRDSIDVGCLQVNLRHHPTAFPTLDDAFDPASNAGYAARYLTLLHQLSPTGDWMEAAGFYHSMTPDRAQGYRVQVQAELGRLAMPALPAPVFPPAARPALPVVPIAARTLPAGDGTLIPASDLREQARRERDPMSAFRVLSIASALDGLARAEAARISAVAKRRNRF